MPPYNPANPRPGHFDSMVFDLEASSNAMVLESPSPTDSSRTSSSDSHALDTCPPPLPVSYRAHRRTLLWRGLGAGVFFVTTISVLTLGFVYWLGLARFMTAWLAAEMAFSIFYWQRHAFLDARIVQHQPASNDPMKAFKLVLEMCRRLRNHMDPRVFISEWFCGANPDEIRRDNVADFLSCVFWNRSRADMESDGMGHVPIQMQEQLEDALDYTMPQGHTQGISAMCHLWEPLRTSYRPLFFYAFTEMCPLLTKVMLLACGCSIGFAPGSGMMYATYKLPPQQQHQQPGSRSAFGSRSRSLGADDEESEACDSSDEERESAQVAAAQRTPIMFLHGVGLGILPYINFVRYLAATGQPVVLLEYKHVSMRLTKEIPTAAEVADAAVELLDHLGVSKACVVGHSYGTFVGSRLAQAHPERLQALALIDPVCCGMFMPHLLGNFLYKEARRDRWSIWLKDQLISFIGREMHCAATFCRRFYWLDLNLWPQDMPPRTLLVMAGQDKLMDVEGVRKLLSESSAQVLYRPDHTHADFMLDRAWQQRIVAEVLAMATARGVPSDGEAEVDVLQ